MAAMMEAKVILRWCYVQEGVRAGDIVVKITVSLQVKLTVTFQLISRSSVSYMSSVGMQLDKEQ